MLKKLIDFWYTVMERQLLSKQAHFTGDFMLTTLVGHFTLPWIGQPSSRRRQAAGNN